MHVGVWDEFGIMQNDRRIVSIGIQTKPTDLLNREVSDIVMHQVKHTDYGSERSNALDSLKDGYCTQSTPFCDGMRSSKYVIQI